MPSPFKFLAPYQKKDKDLFFGRDQEVIQLAEQVQSHPLTLLYGPAGTGKTSLVRCGLSNQFANTDWRALFIRRTHNLSEDLKQTIRADAKSELPEGMPVQEMVRSLYLDRFVPLYFIFDQFEELFLQGTHQEQREFFNTLIRLMNVRQTTGEKFGNKLGISTQGIYCRIIIIMREEFIGYLSEYESRLPALFANKMRLEHMRDYQIRQVISQTISQKAFNIEVEDKNRTVKLIMNNLRDQTSFPLVIQPSSAKHLRDSLYLGIRQASFQGLPSTASFLESVSYLSLEKGLPIDVIFNQIEADAFADHEPGATDLETLFTYEREGITFFENFKQLLFSLDSEEQKTFAETLAALFITGSKEEEDSFSEKLIRLFSYVNQENKEMLFQALHRLFHACHQDNRLSIFKEFLTLFIAEQGGNPEVVLRDRIKTDDAFDDIFEKLNTRFANGYESEKAVFCKKLVKLLLFDQQDSPLSYPQYLDAQTRNEFSLNLTKLVNSASLSRKQAFYTSLIRPLLPEIPESPGFFRRLGLRLGIIRDKNLETVLLEKAGLFSIGESEKPVTFAKQLSRIFLLGDGDKVEAFLSEQANAFTRLHNEPRLDIFSKLVGEYQKAGESTQEMFLKLIPEMFLAANQQNQHRFSSHLINGLMLAGNRSPEALFNDLQQLCLDGDPVIKMALYATRATQYLFGESEGMRISGEEIADLYIGRKSKDSSFFYALFELVSFVKETYPGVYFSYPQGFPTERKEHTIPPLADQFTAWIGEGELFNLIPETRNQTDDNVYPYRLVSSYHEASGEVNESETSRWISESIETETPLQKSDRARSIQNRIDLSNLQVYLDHLYQKAERKSSLISFNPDLVRETGPLSRVMGNFIDEGLHELKLDLQIKKEQEDIPLKVLMALVSDDGGKQKRSTENIVKVVSSQIAASPEDELLIKDCIKKFQEMRIIRA